MDKELLEQILPIVEKTKEGILKGVEVAQEQMPELINQIYAWRFTISLLGFLLGLLLIIATFIIPIILYKKLKVAEEEGCGLVFLGYMLIVPFTAICVENLDWLKILTAPKLFLVEYISNLIK